MKKVILILVSFAISGFIIAQSATNFTIDDCKGTPYDLFTELASGKVIVICWVMPCGPCVGPALTTHNVVQSYQTTHPGKVHMYLCDDYADTPCTSLISWANAYNIKDAVFFSDAAINMNHYGGPGMPKIVVIAPDHSVLYNSNNTVDAIALQAAINTALTISLTSIQQTQAKALSLSVYPNPAKDMAVATFNLHKHSDVEIDLLGPEGTLIENIFSGWLNEGENKIELQYSALRPGIYFIRLNDGSNTKLKKIVVTK